MTVFRCRICNKIFDREKWCCWECFKKAKNYALKRALTDEYYKNAISYMWTDEFREKLAKDYLGTIKETVQFT
jgi:hypothetical protein